jgi:fimbrial isopeptide formation D2 family protein
VVSKSVVPPSGTAVNEGQVLTYTLTFDNTTGRAPATVDHTDVLTKVLDDATVTTQPVVATGTGLTVGPITGGAFTITGTVDAGTTATVTFAVTVNKPDTGDHRLDNFIVPTGTNPPPTCESGGNPTLTAHVAAAADPPSTCTTNPVPGLVVTKSVDPPSGTPVSEGQVLHYTLTFANTVGKAPATVDFTDVLTKVLDDATVTTQPVVATGTGLTVGAITGSAFRITGTVATGATSTVTFAVTVNKPDTGDHHLDNFVVPTGTTPPTECVPSNPRCTTNPVPIPPPPSTTTTTIDAPPSGPLPYTGMRLGSDLLMLAALTILFGSSALALGRRRRRARAR